MWSAMAVQRGGPARVPLVRQPHTSRPSYAIGYGRCRHFLRGSPYDHLRLVVDHVVCICAQLWVVRTVTTSRALATDPSAQLEQAAPHSAAKRCVQQ